MNSSDDCVGAVGNLFFIAPNVPQLPAEGDFNHKTFNLHKILLKARKLGLTANPQLA